MKKINFRIPIVFLSPFIILAIIFSSWRLYRMYSDYQFDSFIEKAKPAAIKLVKLNVRDVRKITCEKLEINSISGTIFQECYINNDKKMSIIFDFNQVTKEVDISGWDPCIDQLIIHSGSDENSIKVPSLKVRED